jgi:arsenate reductase
LAEIGIDHSRARSKSLEEFEGQPFDYVITLCDGANETCPLFFGGVERIHLGFEDPARITGTEEEVLTAFRRVRDQIRETVETYLRNAGRASTTDQDEGKIK